MTTENLYVTVDEAELNQLVVGKLAGHPVSWDGRRTSFRIGRGEFGVLIKSPAHPGGSFKPLVVVSHEEEYTRLFGRFSQLQSDLSPLSAWCHVLPPARFENFDELIREADLGGFEASWIGLAIAEAALLAGRSVTKLKIAACTATQTYALARSKALWPRIPLHEVQERYERCQRILRSSTASQRLRPALDPIWSALIAAGDGPSALRHNEQALLVEGLWALRNARAMESFSEASALHDVFRGVPESQFLLDLERMPPEARLKAFDHLTSTLVKEDAPEGSARRSSLAFLAGYLATVAAGGAPSLGLAEDVASRWPEITAWAYVLGGVGEFVLWTSSFDGLGRLMARELIRPFRLDEPPSCDFALDEALVLVDPQLADPLVHLRIKQLRVLTVALLPGVNISLPIAGEVPAGGRPQVAQPVATSATTTSDPMAALAEALLPYLVDRLTSAQSAGATPRNEGERSSKPKSSKKAGGQQKLPLYRR